MKNTTTATTDSEAHETLLENKQSTKIFERVKLRYNNELLCNDSNSAPTHNEFTDHTEHDSHTNYGGK